MYRYTEEGFTQEAIDSSVNTIEFSMVGLYKSNPLDPQLESAWFQLLHL